MSPGHLKLPSEIVDAHLGSYPAARSLKQLPAISNESSYRFLGTAAGAYVFFSALDFIKENPEKVSQAANAISWCVDNYDHVSTLWSVCDVAGIENVIKGAFAIHDVHGWLLETGWEHLANLVDGLDVIDGILSFGIGSVTGMVITKTFDHLNADKKQRNQVLREQSSHIRYVSLLATRRAPPGVLNKILDQLPDVHRQLRIE